MFTNHYSIEDTLQLHSLVLEYQDNLLNTIDTLGKVFPSDECQTLLSRIKEESPRLQHSLYRCKIFVVMNGKQVPVVQAGPF